MNIQWQPGITLALGEQSIIEQALKFYQGNKTHTAASLDIAVRTLDNKLETYANKRREQDIERERAATTQQNLLNRHRGIYAAEPIASDQPAETGICVEPTSDIEPESPVPMPERTEVQEVLPEKSARRRPGRARTGI